MENRVYAITGGASGIGLALSKILLSKGAKVSISDISKQSLQSAKATLGTESTLYTQLDVSDYNAVQSWIQSTKSHFGRLDGAANVAGTAFKSARYDSRLINQDLEDWDKIIRVNLTGTMYCMREELRNLSSGGSIVNVSSYAGLIGNPRFGAYAAAKHGVIGLTKTAAKEMGKEGIRVNVVIPGNIDTPMFQDLAALPGNEFINKAVEESTPIPRLAEPAEVAKVIAFLLSDDASFVTGTSYSIDGGLLA
ncbi:hypothetical protein BJY04DRAFT_211546 [Aspergillus karnatakaensis]|uniref:SDR family NAD(P)-dependent oxidoreductase n=1 Tax=Aspergillus karnatakaensis TaxID=1810916 RepID=UPI003CCD9459